MRVFLSVEHPAWAHQFHRLVNMLLQDGHEVRIVAIDKDGACELLNKFGMKHIVVGRTTGKNAFEKAWLLFSLTVKYWWHALRFGTDVLIGRATPMMAITSFLLRKKHFIFEDTDHSHISLFFCRLFSTLIVTPNSFRGNLGPKQIRQPLFKESFYLHPDYFVANSAVIRELGLSEQEPFVLLRFVSWRADHDMGWSGLSLDIRKKAVSELSKYAKVFISSELELDPFFRPYQLTIAREKIHHFMYYASLVYGESSTMASEAALLGTHAIFCDFKGRGYTDELEGKYGLVYNFKLDAAAQEESLEKAVTLIKDPELKALGKTKQRVLKEHTIDGTQYMYDLLTKNMSLK